MNAIKIADRGRGAAIRLANIGKASDDPHSGEVTAGFAERKRVAIRVDKSGRENAFLAVLP